MVAVLLASLIAFAPALVWLAFFLREDVHPEPKKWLAITFFGGAVVSVPVFFIQWGLEGAFTGVGFILIVGYALIEETFKFFTAYLIVHKNPVFDEPVDAMIYLVVAALGFATVENVFVMNGMTNTLASLGEFLAAGAPLYTLSLRLVGATLLHALASGLVGYYWARGIAVRQVGRFVCFGILAATVLHAFFNLLVSAFENSPIVYPTLFLVVAGFFVLADFEQVRGMRS
jgi:RsiW-degrading membrane proteinase PrsW (M82 family)